MLSEFEIIERYFVPIAESDLSVLLGPGDDCAIVRVSQPTDLAISIDTLVEGVHFLPDIAPDNLAWRLLGSAVSDLAAMGAEPLWLTLALTLPETDHAWLERFASALSEACHAFNIKLVGGDTTSGSCRVLTAQVQGRVPTDAALKRAGAQSGDLICISGTLGDSRAGLALLLGECSTESVELADYLLARFYRPTPRIQLGLDLRGYATAAIDVSDGFLADLSHLLKRSGVGAEIDMQRLPISAQLNRFVTPECALDWAATGGEDFELCFTLSEASYASLAKTTDTPVAVVGRIIQGSGLKLLQGKESYLTPESLGFDHFGVKC